MVETKWLGKRKDGSKDFTLKAEERFQLNLYCMVLMGISSYAQSKMRKLADMIKGSATEKGRVRYCLKRDYYKRECKQWVPRLEASDKAFEKKVTAMLTEVANDRGTSADSSIAVIAELIDWSEEYLTKDILELRKALRKEMKLMHNNEVEDLTMVGHLFETIAVTCICQTLYAKMCQRQPLLNQIRDYSVFGCLAFRNVLNGLSGCLDLRMKDGSGVKLKEEVFISERVKPHMTGLLDKLTSVDYASRVNQVMCEADGMLYQNFKDYFPTDNILGPMPKVSIVDGPGDLIYTTLEKVDEPDTGTKNE